jgi:creatinine amidohydrolase
MLILPIGAIEQHGPHLPIDTDSVSVTAVAEAAALLAGPENALVLPTIPWGLSPYWLPFAGTITLRPETILTLISDIGRSVAAHGFHSLLILNGHGGNAGIIAVAATQLADHGIRATSISYWSLIGPDLGEITPEDHGHIGHAGQTETSLQLHLQPDLVDPTYRKITEWANLGSLVDSLTIPGAYSPPNPATESPNGIYGDVTAARSELGKRVIDLAAERLARFVTDLHRRAQS